MSVLDVIYILIVGSPLVGAWFLWFSRDRQRLRSTRRYVAVTGLGTVSLAAVGLFGALVHSISLGGFTHYRRLFDAWLQPNLVICFIALILTVFGRGASRVLGLIATLLILIIWVGSAVTF